MAFIHLKRRWMSPPTGRVAIRDDFLSLKLKNAYLFTSGNSYKDVVTGNYPTFSVNSTKHASHVRTAADANGYIELPISSFSGAPVSFIVAERYVSGNVGWSILRNNIEGWYGYYSSISLKLLGLQNDWGNYLLAGSSTVTSGVIAASDAGTSMKVFVSSGGSYYDSAGTAVSGYSFSKARLGQAMLEVPDHFSVAEFSLFCVFHSILPDALLSDLAINPWQIFAPQKRALYFNFGAGATTHTSSAALDSFIQRSGITKYASLDALLKSIKSASVGFDSLLSALKNKSLTIDGLVYLLQTKTVSLDSLVRMAKSQSLSVDALMYAVLSQHATLDALLKSSDISKTISLDSLIQATKTSTLSLDAIVLGAGSGLVSTALDGLIQAIKTKTLSLDAMLRSDHVSTAQLDALLSAFKTKTLSLDAIVSGIPTRSLTLDALLKIGRSVSVSLDAIVAAALASAVSFDAVLFLAGSLSTQVDAYLQKEKARYTRLDAFIGAFVGAWMPDGRALFISGGDRFVRQQVGDRLVIVPGNSRDININ